MPHQPSSKPPASDAVPPTSASHKEGAIPQGIIHASDLLGSRQAVDIEYNGQHYRLQTTRAGKLILTK